MSRRGERGRWIAGYAATCLASLAVGCGDGPIGPTPTNPPTVSCPADVTLAGVTGGAQTVTFPQPTTTGGAAPVNVVCAPASGALFNVGTTAVACTATDAMARQAQCAFAVTLTPVLLSVTRFVAFGDSLTEGENGRLRVFGPGFLDIPNAYPTKLQLLLKAEYSGQNLIVSDRGKSGRAVEDGVIDLPGVLAGERGDVVLLLDGYNNLLNGCPASDPGTTGCAPAIDVVVEGLREYIHIAKKVEFGIKYIFVSTLTPPGPFVGGQNDRRIASQAIAQTNAKLSAMVRSEGVTLVDPYPLFLGHESEYVDQDGLHLRPPGYQVLAETFFGAIKSTVPPAPAFGVRAP